MSSSDACFISSKKFFFLFYAAELNSFNRGVKCAGCDRPCRSVAKRSYPMSEVRGSGRKELTHVQGAVAAWAQEGLEELFHVKVRRGGGEEIPLVQGKEQRLLFAGVAVKRYPMSKVRETEVRW